MSAISIFLLDVTEIADYTQNLSSDHHKQLKKVTMFYQVSIHVAFATLDTWIISSKCYTAADATY
jgi:hypothetical protein